MVIKSLFFLLLIMTSAATMENNSADDVQIEYKGKRYLGESLTEKKYNDQSWKDIVNNFLSANNPSVIKPLDDLYIAAILNTEEFKSNHKHIFKYCICLIQEGTRNFALLEAKELYKRNKHYFSGLIKTLEKIDPKINFEKASTLFLLEDYEQGELSGVLASLDKTINELKPTEELQQKLDFLNDLLSSVSNCDLDEFKSFLVKSGFQDTDQEMEAIFNELLKHSEQILSVKDIFGDDVFVHHDLQQDDLEDNSDHIKKTLQQHTKDLFKDTSKKIINVLDQWKQNNENLYKNLFEKNITIFEISPHGELTILGNNNQGKKMIKEIHLTIGYESDKSSNDAGDRKFSKDLIAEIKKTLNLTTERQILEKIKGEFTQFLDQVVFNTHSLYGNWIVTEGQTGQTHPLFSTPHISWTELQDNIIRVMSFAVNKDAIQTIKNSRECIKDDLAKNQDKLLQHKLEPNLDKIFIRAYLTNNELIGIYLPWKN